MSFSNSTFHAHTFDASIFFSCRSLHSTDCFLVHSCRGVVDVTVDGLVGVIMFGFFQVARVERQGVSASDVKVVGAR